MQPGPKPKPTAIRVFEGNPGNIPLNQREPKPDVSNDPTPPAWLDADTQDFDTSAASKMIWEQFFPVLSKLGVITEIDRDKFGRYCYLLALWLKCKAFVDKHGMDHPVFSEYWGQEKNEKGENKAVWKRVLKKMQPYPQAARLITLSKELSNYEAEFGIGAASRTRIQTIVADALKNKDSETPKSEFDYAARQGLRKVK